MSGESKIICIKIAQKNKVLWNKAQQGGERLIC